jgi:hypothetical protein
MAAICTYVMKLVYTYKKICFCSIVFLFLRYHVDLKLTQINNDRKEHGKSMQSHEQQGRGVNPLNQRANYTLMSTKTSHSHEEQIDTHPNTLYDGNKK